MPVTNYPVVSGVGAGGGDSVASYVNVAAFPVTGEVDKIYIDEANADLYLWDGAVYELQGGTVATETGFWFRKPTFPDDLNYTIEEFDTFPIQVGNGVGNMYGPVTGASAAVQVRDVSETQAGINSTEKAIGVTSLNPGTSATGRAGLGWGGAQGAASFRIGILKMIFGIRQNLWAVGSAGENYTLWVGFFDIVTAQPTNGVYFRYNYAVNGGRWEYCTTVAGATTAADTGVGFTAQVYQVMEVEINAAGTSVTFYIDGTLVGTISSGLPTSVGLLAMSNVLRSAGTGSGGAGVESIDAMYIALEKLAVR